MQGKYKIRIVVENSDSGDILGVRECNDVDKLNSVFSDIPNWINRYEEKNYGKCMKCNNVFHISELSSPDTDDTKFICQECLDKLLTGEISL